MLPAHPSDLTIAGEIPWVQPGAVGAYGLRAEGGAHEGRALVEGLDVLKEIEVRDYLDSTREDAPLTRTEGAVYLDTTGMRPEEVLETMLRQIEGDDG